MPSIRCQVTPEVTWHLRLNCQQIILLSDLLHLYSPAQRNISLYIRLYISAVFFNFFYWI